MSELHQSGSHPDADQINAFVEHALPPHEREQTLAHLAACPACRTIVSLSLPPVGEPVRPQAQPARRPWFSGWNLAWPVAAAFAALVPVLFYVHKTVTPPSNSAAPTQMADSQPPALAGPALSTPPLAEKTPSRRMAIARPVSPPTVSSAAPVAATAPGPRDEAFLAPLPVGVQNYSSEGIQGRITDKDGRVIPKANVTATNTDTGVATTRVTNGSGEYSIAPLQPGDYIVDVTATGFQRLLQDNVMVAEASAQRLDEKLTVGSNSETITISDAPPFLDTTNATVGGTVENELYSNLPLSMSDGPRDPAAFQYLAPGVQKNPANNAATAAQSGNSAGNSGGNSGIYGGSGATNLNQNYIDGVPAPNVNQAGSSNSISGAALAGATGQGASGQIGTAAKTLQAHLPSGLPTLSTASSGLRTVALDTANTLFVSDDGGQRWRQVPSQWKGRALKVDLASLAVAQARGTAQTPRADSAASPAAAVPIAPVRPMALFELTTDSGDRWTSSDGQTWTRQ